MPNYRILIVDDSLFSRMNLRSMLESHGHQVAGEAPDGISALELYKSSKPDLVTMDLNMPESTGVDAIRNIAAFDPKARFLVVSAVERRLVWDQCASIGTCEYVSKPTDWSKLKTAMDNLMKASDKSSVQGKGSKKK
jgi:two-component system chemotaxis response regulator CheY